MTPVFLVNEQNTGSFGKCKMKMRERHACIYIYIFCTAHWYSLAGLYQDGLMHQVWCS